MSVNSGAVYDSGMGASPFEAEGRALSVRMEQVEAVFSEPAGREEVFAVLDGSVRVICDSGEEHLLGAGDGLLIPADMARNYEPSGKATIYWVRRK